MRRPLAVVPGFLLGLLLGACWCVLPASADELPPPAYPSGLPKPGDIGNDVPDGGYTPGPTIVITPGSTGTALPQPGAGTPTPGGPASTLSPGATPTASPTTDVPAVPGAAPRTASAPVDGGSPVWLAIAAGAVVLLGLLAVFGGILQRRVTRDPASR